MKKQIYILFFLTLATLACQTTLAQREAISGSQRVSDDDQSPLGRKAGGILYFKKGMLEDAVEELTFASEKIKGDAELHHYLGKAYYELDKLKDAVTEFLAAVSFYRPDKTVEKAEAYSDLGLAYKNLKASSESFAAYKESLALNPLKADTNYYLGIL